MEIVLSIIAIIVSIISIAVSAICAFITHSQNKKLNRINIKAKYFSQVFDEYLICKIPQARKYLRFNENKLVDTQELSDVLGELLNSSLYFRYDNNKFYKNIKGLIQEIDDYIMECGNHSYEQEEQAEVYSTLQEKLESLYKFINDNYVGK